MEIVIQPASTTLTDDTLNDLVNDILREFEGIRVTLADSVNSSLTKNANFHSLFDTTRNKWNSPKLLDWFYDRLKPKTDRVISSHHGCRCIFAWLEFCFG